MDARGRARARKKSFDWVGTLVWFICGAFLGMIAGLGIWAFWLDGETWTGGLACIGGSAAVLGMLSALFGESFWEFIGENWDLLLPW